MVSLPEQQARQTIDAMLAAAALGSLVWPTIRLGDCVTKIGSGSTPRGGEAVYVKKGVPLIRSMNVHFDGLRPEGLAFITKAEAEKLKNVTVQEGDVLLNITGASIGRVTTVPGELAGARVNQHVCIIRPMSALLPKFLAYFFATPVEQMRINECQVGATRQALTKQMIEDWQVPLPTVEEQQQIVGEIEKQFTRLEAGVAALRRVQANLKRYRAAVLKAACEGRLVTTEDELARTEGRPFESGQQLLACILTERRQIHERAQSSATRKKKYKEPIAPSIPADEALPPGWTWATWDQIGVSQNGRPFPSAQYQETGFKLLRPGNLHVSGKVIWTDGNTRCMPQDFADENPDLIVGANKLVMNLTAQSLKDEFLGRVCITAAGEACLLNQRLARLTPVIVLPEFALYLLKAWRFRRFVDGLNSGSLIQHMFTSQLAEFTFPLPPLAEQIRIVAEVERRLSVLEELEAVVNTNLQRGKRLRGSILASSFRSKRSAERRPTKTEVRPALSRQTVKPIRPIITPMKKQLKLTPESLVETVRRNKGKMTPSDLCLASSVEEEVEAFFEALRECRDLGLLAVPSGIGAIIKLAKS